MKLIGKGLFTKCFMNDDGVTVTLKSKCNAKECMAFGWFPESYLFPTIKRFDYDENGYGWYTMPFYARAPLHKALEPKQWQLYKALRELKIVPPLNLQNTANAWYDAFGTLPAEFAEEREALEEAISAMGNYGADIAFEISPRNVRAVNGKLLLLDCFFVISQAKAKRNGTL